MWYVDIIHLGVSHRVYYIFWSQYPNLPAQIQAAYQDMDQHALPLPPPPEPPGPALPAPEMPLAQPAPPLPVPFAPAPFPMPPPAAVAQLPEAQRPFSPAWQVHDLGHIDVVCSGCGALHWMDEKLSASTCNYIIFGMCCFSGKMDLPKLHEPPELLELLTGTDDIAKNFCKDIRSYNNALAMTSLGCKTDSSVNQGGGPYVFKVHGRLTHQAGSLLPPPDGQPTYAQLYIYDSADALNYHMGHQANSTLHRQTMQRLQDMLWHKHPGAQLYKQAHELTCNMGPDQDCNIALHFDKSCD